ncbi:MAG: putative oxidoreductase (related to aryl-alcohol dehydrogenase) [halophilic archaeon J07HX5]|nr:MAG: putative oxidoreductase (related to aryl-alcohol dehydrogenase) [halophilic archaeon J07HX5]
MPPATFQIGDRTINRMGFGAMRITGPGVIGPPEDEATARDLVRRALELGVDFIDTADAYGPGVSERLLGATDAPDRAVVASKAGLLRTPDGEWLPHGDPEYIKNQVLASRDRLGVETIDLYQLHRPDPETPLEETVHAFAELRDRGLIEHVGLSNVDVDQLERAREVVEIATVQNRYNVAHRADERVLAACEAHEIGFMPWYPLAAGEFGAASEPLAEIATNHDATVYQVALAWLLHHSEVLLPIPGTSSHAHLADNVAAAAIELTDDEYARLEAVAA